MIQVSIINIFLATSIILAIATAGYGGILFFSIIFEEGGDSIGPIGVLAIMGMIFSMILTFLFSCLTLGLWFARKNQNTSIQSIRGLL